MHPHQDSITNAIPTELENNRLLPMFVSLLPQRCTSPEPKKLVVAAFIIASLSVVLASSSHLFIRFFAHHVAICGATRPCHHVPRRRPRTRLRNLRPSTRTVLEDPRRHVRRIWGFLGLHHLQGRCLGVIPNHTSNYWGNQVWYDLLYSTGLFWLALVRRAKKLGMPLAPWFLYVAGFLLRNLI